jgi:hypothetical protein
MRIKLWLVLACFTIQQVSAQEVYNSSGKTGKANYKENRKPKGFDVNRLMFGGGLGFGMGSGSIAFSITPVVGYRITDNFSAGVSLGYQYFRVKDFFSVYNQQTNLWDQFNYNSNMFSGGVWARYVLWQNIFAHVEFENNITTYKDYFLDQGTARSERVTNYVPCGLVGGGFRQPMGDNASFIIMALYDVLQDIPSNTRVSPRTGERYSLSPYAGRIDFRIGFLLGF